MGDVLDTITALELMRLGRNPVAHILIKNGGEGEHKHMFVVEEGKAEQFDFIVYQSTCSRTKRMPIPSQPGDPVLVGMCVNDHQLQFLEPPCPFVNFIEVADLAAAKTELAKQKLEELGLAPKNRGRKL